MEYLLLALAMALMPIYSFASGGVQYSHLAIGLLILIRLIRMKWEMQPAEVALISLLVLIIFREAYGILVDGVPVKAVLEVLYIAFATLTLVTFSRLSFDRPIYVRAFLAGFSMALLIALWGLYHYGATLTVSEGQISRSVGTFNNPNQLAYFSVCVLSIASLFYLRGQIGRPLFVIFIMAAFLFAISAISKAGLLSVGSATLVAIAALLNRNRLSGTLIVFCALMVAVVLQLYLSGALDNFYFVHRLQEIGGDSDDNLAARGYFTLKLSNPLTLMFGLGQAKVQEILGHEVHSTFASFFVKYGLAGIGLFLLFWYQWVKRVWIEFRLLGVILIAFPATLFGITHNGSRFAIFWVLIGLCFNDRLVARKPEAKAAPPTAWPGVRRPNVQIQGGL